MYFDNDKAEELMVSFLYNNHEDLVRHLDDLCDDASLDHLALEGIKGLVKSERGETVENIKLFCEDYGFDEFVYNEINNIQ